jgi:CBS domain-containing protein
MQWKGIHHLPVENDAKELCGIISWKTIEEMKQTETMLVKDVMSVNVLSVSYTTSIEEAIDLMKRNQIGCLPVLEKKQLIGIVTAHDAKAFEASLGNQSKNE